MRQVNLRLLASGNTGFPLPNLLSTAIFLTASLRELDYFQALGIKRYTSGRRPYARAEQLATYEPLCVWLGGTYMLHGGLMVVAASCSDCGRCALRGVDAIPCGHRH